MLNFNEYVSLNENFNQMVSIMKKHGVNAGPGMLNVEGGIEMYSKGADLLSELLRGDLLPGEYIKKKVSDKKTQDLYGNLEIDEERERVMRPYLGMFTKMVYDENCPINIVGDIATYIMSNKNNLKLTVKNNVTGESQVLSNLLDIFKYKEHIKENGDTRPAYEIITDAIRDTNKERNLTSFINEMPSILKQQFKIDNNRKKLNDIFNIYDDIENEHKKAIHTTFFGDGSNTTGKISRYKNADEFLKDFNTLINNRSNFDIDKIKDEITSTPGAKLLVCDYKNKYIIADIWTHSTSNKLGEPSSWCISYKNDDFWHDNYMGYSLNRKMFFIWNFNLEQTNPLSKIAANINHDGSLNLVCDKNDKSIDYTFEEYLKEHKIKTSFIKTPISEEEFKIKKNDYTLHTLRANIFNTVDINDNNYKEEIINRLDLCKENNIDVTSYKLSLAIHNLVSYVYSSSRYRYEIEIYNICLDEFGVDDYMNDLFSLFLTSPNISRQPIPQDAIKPLCDLYERLGSNIDLNILEEHLNEFEFLDSIPVIKNAIIKEIEKKLYTKYIGQDTKCKYIDILGFQYMDDNFDNFFYDFIGNNITDEIGILILKKIAGKQTKNNFIKKLNDIGVLFNKADFLSYEKISNTTGVNKTVFNVNNYDCILGIFIIDSVYDKIDNKQSIIKEFLGNNKKYNCSILLKYNSYYVPLAVKFLLSFDIDISDCSYGMPYKPTTYQKYYNNKITIFLYDILHNKVEISVKEDFGNFIQLIFTENMYVGEENIKIINQILDITPTLDISIDLSLEDISKNIPLCEAIVKYDVLKDNSLFQSVIIPSSQSNKVKKIREMYNYLFK